MTTFIKFNVFTLLAVLLSFGSACNTTPHEADDDDFHGDDDDASDDDDATGDDDDVQGDDDDDDFQGDDDDSSHSDREPPTAEEFEELARQAREDLVQVFTRDADAIGVIEGAEGTILSFPYAHSLSHEGGGPVYGDIDIELLEIFDKGSMLVTDMPAVGLNPYGEIAQLISGGEHFVNATQEGEQLELHMPFVLTAPVSEDEEDAEAMGLFRAEGEAGLEDDVLWIEQEPNPDEFGVVREDDPNGGGMMAATEYWTLSSQFGWTNIDRWYADPRPKTTIHVDVPDGWDDTNCAVYLSYDGEPTALAGFDMYDVDAELFTEHYGLIPIGLEVHVILVTENDGLWSYAILGETIVEDHLTVFASADDLIDTDMEGLTEVINALP